MPVAMAVCRHPLLHADYLMWKEAAARNQPQSSKAASAGPLRRLSNRKDVMARNAGTFTEVRTLCHLLLEAAVLHTYQIYGARIWSCTCPALLGADCCASFHISQTVRLSTDQVFCNPLDRNASLTSRRSYLLRYMQSWDVKAGVARSTVYNLRSFTSVLHFFEDAMRLWHPCNVL